MLDPASFNRKAVNDSRPMREYIVKEALLQYKDYYETDGEEQTFFEYFDNLTNRDMIRFGEVYTDYTIDKSD